MAQAKAWRNFKRMQVIACVFASLIYAAAVIHAWRVLPGATSLKAAVTLAFPAVYCVASVVLSLLVAPVRRMLKRYVWMSFAAGFGQSATAVLAPLALLAIAAVFMYVQSSGAADGGRYPAGVFSGYGAGIGILIAQALLVLALERDPEVREQIGR